MWIRKKHQHKQLNEVNNDLVHNYYFLQYGKIYNKEKTKYRPFKYVIFFDNYDLQEYFEDTKITNKNIKYYANEFTPSELYQIKEYDDLEHLKEFFSYCKETIKDYNNIV